jgi:hypothetical protein
MLLAVGRNGTVYVALSREVVVLEAGERDSADGTSSVAQEERRSR